ncbi:MAG TPA: GNAT family N-acetyltransferase [Ktedonobacteraceae bacterium]|jgi:ribosomal protein S18 acetylase RimI-like enzyme|nr:GNAT family N-acetyltransferase [Ktedonobacteraceae bacterium]
MSFIQDTRLEVRPLTIEDAPACDQIILSLPHHFGYESGRAACAQEVRTGKGWVVTLDGHVVGFLTVQDYFNTTAEITWMAVHAQHRGQGIGKRLIQRLRQEMKARGYRLLLVSTLASSYDEGPTEDGYARTRAFYQAVGFLPVREVPLYWGEGSDPALLLVMPL